MKIKTLFFSLFTLCLFTTPPALAQRLGATWGTGDRESEYYKIVNIPIPKDLFLETGSFEILPDGRLVVGTRRGQILLISGVFDKRPQPKVQEFASGLDEVFGVGYRNGAFYVTQQTEVTKITDLDGDNRADRFETLSDAWGFLNYHEFAWGSRPDKNGDVWVVLGLSNSYHYRAPFRGWAFRVTPDGKSIPIASGIRSAGGVGPNEHGVMFYTESQGPWNGSCSLKHLKPGGFMGHPISFEAYPLAPNMGKKPKEPQTGSRIHVEKKNVPELVPYAVVFPYRKMGQSISGFRVDNTQGKFGPFKGQLFVSDYSTSCVMRTTTEKVNGVWQGACYPFREGLSTGILAVQFSPKGYLLTGGTNRGWPVRGSKNYVLERLEWTGKIPFEVHEIKIQPKGFNVRFTLPVDPQSASNPQNYSISNYTHIYHKFYGSPEVDQGTIKVTKASVSADGLNVQLDLEKILEGHVHDFDFSKVLSKDKKPLLHTKAYYTVNEIPR